MVVAMIAVGMMEVTFDQIVDVVAVRHRLMAAARTVNVACLVSFTAMMRRACVRIRTGHGQLMLIVMIAMGMQQVAVLEEIRVPVVFDGHVAARFAVLVNVPLV
jgi:hypothetical protein